MKVHVVRLCVRGRIYEARLSGCLAVAAGCVAVGAAVRFLAPRGNPSSPGPARACEATGASRAPESVEEDRQRPAGATRSCVASQVRRLFTQGAGVDLETSEERELFEEWAAAAGARGKGALVLLSSGEDQEERRAYDLSLDGTTVAGTVEVERVDGRWRLRGLRKKRSESELLEEARTRELLLAQAARLAGKEAQ